MARVTGPLLSLGARGTIAGTATFASWRGVQYVRQRVVPANPNTVPQQQTRGVFATMSAAWKNAGAISWAPWQAYAQGRPFLPRNAYIGENVRALRGATDMLNYVGSPGALGGLAPESVTAAATANPGELQVTVTAPPAPQGWQLAGIAAVAFPDQPPDQPFIGPITEAEDTSDPFGPLTLSGLASGVTHVVSAWTLWTRPDGRLAYGPSVNTTGTPM